MHKVPLLWHFNQIHHSAEVLTPFTVARAQPLKILEQALMLPLFLGIAVGLLTYSSDSKLDAVSVLLMTGLILRAMMRIPKPTALALVVGLLIVAPPAARAHETLAIWPMGHKAVDAATAGEIIYAARLLARSLPTTMIRNVATPTVTVYRPARACNIGTAIVICRGGAFRILDWDAEGTMLAERLAARVMTAFVLTPVAPDVFEWAMAALGEPRSAEGLRRLADKFGDAATVAGQQLAREDASQSMRFVRRDAHAWGIKRDRVGMLEFSARAFVAVDTAFEPDAASQLDFVAAIYGGETNARSIPAEVPPLFASVAENDELGLAPIVRRLARDWRAGGSSVGLTYFPPQVMASGRCARISARTTGRCCLKNGMLRATCCQCPP